MGGSERMKTFFKHLQILLISLGCLKNLCPVCVATMEELYTHYLGFYTAA